MSKKRKFDTSKDQEKILDLLFEDSGSEIDNSFDSDEELTHEDTSFGEDRVEFESSERPVEVVQDKDDDAGGAGMTYADLTPLTPYEFANFPTSSLPLQENQANGDYNTDGDGYGGGGTESRHGDNTDNLSAGGVQMGGGGQQDSNGDEQDGEEEGGDAGQLDGGGEGLDGGGEEQDGGGNEEDGAGQNGVDGEQNGDEENDDVQGEGANGDGLRRAPRGRGSRRVVGGSGEGGRGPGRGGRGSSRGNRGSTRGGRGLGRGGRGRGPQRPARTQSPDSALRWTRDKVAPAPHPFTGYPQTNTGLEASSQEIDYFFLFFGEDQLRHVKSETNRYAASMLRNQNDRSKHSILGNWSTVKLIELFGFFSIIIHMCLYPRPEINDFWSTDSFDVAPFCASVMSRKRFKAIMSALHLNDNSNYISKGNPGHDPLFKIRPIYDFMNAQFFRCLSPQQNLTIDEGMCGFRGRVIFRVYMPLKPEKYGIKIFILCEASTGYIIRMEVYSGRGDLDNSATALLDRLLAGLHNKGHCVFMDRFYSGPRIYDALYSNGTNAVGTVMPNRQEMPVALRNKKLQTGEMIHMQRDALCAIKWKDKRDVYALSTKHGPTSSLVTVKSREGRLEKSKPDIIIDYNANKVGVDRADQMAAYYPFARKTLKWWKKLFFHLLIRALANAFILYKKENPAKKCRLRTFMKAVGKQFAEKAQVDPVVPNQNVNRLEGRHFPRYNAPTGNKERGSRACKVCTAKSIAKLGKRKKNTSVFSCNVCDIGLCVPRCFEKYHTLEKYDYSTEEE